MEEKIALQAAGLSLTAENGDKKENIKRE